MEAGFAAKHLDCGFEQHNCCCAIDVVIAVEEDGLMVGDGGFKAVGGGGHAVHQKWIMEVG
jgi:hypothetical protein